MKSKSLIRLIFGLSVLLPVLTTQVNGDIQEGQRNALIALYNSTNGAGWLNNTNWNGAPGTENTWYGVTCDKANTVVLELDLSGNNLSGAIPTELGNLSNLIYLNLSSNQLTGQIPPELGDLSNLTILDLHSNRLAEIPPELGNLSSVTHLYLDNNEIGGNIPSSLGNLANLEKLSLHFNLLGGSIPPELGNLANLEKLYLYRNQLTGNIPPELGNLANLESLYLRYNKLTGSIPPELGKLGNLVDLDLHSNQLTGSVPPELGNLVNLERLYLRFNTLTGSIPPELGKLANLTILDLRFNRLSGGIPPELGNLLYLEALYLFGNQLKGEIPSNVVFLTNLSDDISDFRWNALYTKDETLRNFLNKKQVGGDWESTQTIAPEDVSARPLNSNSIELTWPPIPYSRDTGGYRVYYSTTPGGPYDWFGTTDDKTVSRMQITGLREDTTYYFVIATQTAPHKFNQNTVESDYSAEVSARAYDVTISGRVTTAEGQGVVDVILNFSNHGGTAITDHNGYYSHILTPGWSGEVTPSKYGYDFHPASRPYREVYSDQVDQDYTADAINPVISGRVTISTTTGSEGLSGVTLTFSSDSGESETVTTDSNGYYSHVVDFGWTGEVRPKKEGYDFFPPFQPYKNVDFDKPNQNYIASAFQLVISGRVATTVGEGVPDVTLTASGTSGIDTTTTDTNGNYNFTFSYGWSGTVTPSKRGYEFNPPSIPYENITSNRLNENYEALEVILVISGIVTISTDTGIKGLPDVMLKFHADTGEIKEETTMFDGSYAHEVDRGWCGTVTPIKQGYHFSPARQEYKDVDSHYANQNYAAAKDSVILEITAWREVEGTVAIKKDYGKIELKLIEVKGALADHYIIYRTSSTGEEKKIERIPGSKLQRGIPEYYYDRYLEENVRYTYSAKAYDSQGKVLGGAVGNPI